jgi:hypothetical protein
MQKGISPVTLRRCFNPKPHAGTDAQPSSLGGAALHKKKNISRAKAQRRKDAKAQGAKTQRRKGAKRYRVLKGFLCAFAPLRENLFVIAAKQCGAA